LGAPVPTHHEDGAPPVRLAPGGDGAPGRSGRGPGGLEQAAVLPLPILGAAMLALWATEPARAYAAPGILLALNFVFLALVPSLVAYLGVRGFLVRGEPALLLLAAGSELLAVGSLFSTIGGWSEPNHAVTIHNTTALLAGGCHLAGALVARRSLTIRAVDTAAAATLAGALLLSTLIAGATLEGRMPLFFVQGVGGTPLRNGVLGAAVLLFAAAAIVLGLSAAPSRFRRYYALALALLAAGLAGVLVQPSFGSALGWVARGTQYVGGAYMLVAAVAAVRATKGWSLSLEAGLADAESRVRARDARFRAFFESLREAVAVYGPVRDAHGAVVDWVVQEANELYADALGTSRARVVGARIGDLFPEQLARWSTEWRQVLETRHPLSYEREVGDRTFAVTCFPLEDEDMIAASSLDITGRKRMEEALRESERLYRAIGESIDYGVWVCDPDGRNVYASESFLRLVGLTQQECSEFGWGNVLHPDDADRTIAAWKECCRTGGTWDIEHRYRGVDGAWHPILARGVPVRNEAGEIVAWAGINLDIAKLKAAEQELRDSDRRKSEFLAVLSHELRNPLAPIRNAVHLLGLAPADSPQSRRAREVIERQVTHLARLVDDILDVTRLSRGKVTLARQRLDLRDAVIRTCDDHRPLLSQRGLGLQVSVGDPAVVDADPTRIAQVIGNLLQNAAKFTPAGGTVKVSLARVDGRAELQVEDDGAGLDASLLPRMFEPFMQAERTLARTQGGLGLGLSLVKGFVELHGGTVAARSEGAGRGATFTVTLPLAEPQVAAPPPEQRASAAERLDILVVEDGEDAAATLGDLLELAGHRVRIARDGRSGVELARRSPPDLVLCDLGLPDLDGFGVARALRADPALRGTRLVALSGYALPEDRVRSAEAGFDAHLAKPAQLADLELLLGDLVRARAARR
jgi:PAS domain S-box-containing protein